jgi:hypothetical protein
VIRQAVENVEHRQRTPRESVTTTGITVVLEDVIRQIEALGDDVGT